MGSYKDTFQGEVEQLKNYCESITDCHHSTPVYTQKGKLVIRNFNIKNGRMVLDKISFTDEENFSQRTSRAKPKAEDLVITREAPMGEVCIIPEGMECCLGQRMVLIKPNFKKVDNKYLLYSLLSEYTQIQIGKSNNTGSIVSNLRIPLLKELLIPSNELATQQKIGNILGSIDKKIEINNKINTELEAMAKLIYDYWFVQFDFPDTNGKPYKSSGGKMVYNDVLKRETPDGWESKYLSELSDRIGDGIHGTPKYTDNSEFRFINGNNLKNGFICVNEETKKITSEEHSKYFIKLDKNTILLSINGTLGNLAIYTDEKIMLGKSSAYINCLEGHRAFCYQYLKQKHMQKLFWNMATGSTIKNLSLDSLKKLKLIYPGLELVSKFNNVVSPMNHKRENIFKENQGLTELRDWLLPMLMNGQVTIHNTEKSA